MQLSAALEYSLQKVIIYDLVAVIAHGMLEVKHRITFIFRNEIE